MVLALGLLYLTAGFTFSVAGPAARALDREVMSVRIGGAPAWKTAAFRFLMMCSITLLWPILVPSAVRASRPALALTGEFSPNLSPDALAFIASVRENEPRVMALAEFQTIASRVGYRNLASIYAVMNERGYLVSLGTTKDGRSFPATVHVADEIGQHIVLDQTGPDTWNFTTSDESWRHLAGRAGEARTKDGVIVSAHVLVMN